MVLCDLERFNHDIAIDIFHFVIEKLELGTYSCGPFSFYSNSLIQCFGS